MKEQCRFLNKLLPLVFMFSVCQLEAEGISVAPTGYSVVTAKLNRSDVRVRIRTARIGRSNPLFPTEATTAKEGTVVSNLEITVDGHQVVVPRAVFLDLFDPTEAFLGFDSGNFVLEIRGGDTVNNYFVRAHF